MRTLQISTDVYAALWAARQSGEDSEEEILRRLLRVGPRPALEKQVPAKIGFVDARHNIELVEGFEIFRVYKGQRIRALARDRKWMIPETGQSYASLNLLSHAVTGRNENTWQSWYFLRDGKRVLINALRRSTDTSPKELGL